MLNLNETLLAHDPVEALRDEVGKFEVISPKGEKFTVICRPGVTIAHILVETDGQFQRKWEIRKVGELQLVC